MSTTTPLKFGVWGIFVVVSLLAIFLFIFRDVGYNSYALRTTLLVRLSVALLFFGRMENCKKSDRIARAPRAPVTDGRKARADFKTRRQLFGNGDRIPENLAHANVKKKREKTYARVI